MSAVIGVMSKLAYISPDLVLPIVNLRFEKALETVTSAHLLVTAIHTLSLTIRPLLVAGFNGIRISSVDHVEAPGLAHGDQLQVNAVIAHFQFVTYPLAHDLLRGCKLLNSALCRQRGFWLPVL